MAKEVYRSIIETVDENGEVKKSEMISTKKINKEPPFIKMYLDDIAGLAQISESPKDTLYYILGYADYENLIYLNYALIKKTAESQGVSEKTIRNNLSNLSKSGILIHTDRGTYMLNPFYFAKGEWKNIEKMRLTIDYDLVKGKRKIKNEVVSK